MAKTIDISITGTADLVAALAALGPNAREALSAALYQEGQAVLSEAKEQTPIKTGVLRASGFVEAPVENGNEISTRVGFGGAASAYALRQHEDLTLHHTVGGAKFLERPALAHANGLGAKLADAIRTRWGA